MNFKKLLVLLVFAIAIIGIIAPAEAKLTVGGPSTYYDKPINGKSLLGFVVSSDIGIDSDDEGSANDVSKRKAELNNVNKVVVSIKGYKDVTFKKPAKGWKTSYKSWEFTKTFSVKGNPIKKSYTVKLYDKKNKSIKALDQKGKIRSAG